MTELDYEAHYEPATDTAAELLALATVLEIPRPGTALPLQLRRSYGYADRWAICDRTGRRWHREHGWVVQDDGLRYEAERDDSRYTLAEAVPLARQLAEASDTDTPQPVVMPHDRATYDHMRDTNPRPGTCCQRSGPVPHWPMWAHCGGGNGPGKPIRPHCTCDACF